MIKTESNPYSGTHLPLPQASPADATDGKRCSYTGTHYRLDNLLISKYFIVQLETSGDSKLPKGQDTKEQILELAEHLIMSRGYNGFSYKDIASALDIRNAAVHYHFPSKKDLGVAVIRRVQARFRQWDAMSASRQLSPVEMLDQALETYIGYLDSDKYVCLGGSLETDFHTLPDEMQKEVRIYTAEILTWMRNLLSRGREEGQFAFAGPSEDKAFFMIASIQGALQMARVSDKAMFYRTVDNLKSELGL